MKSENDNYEFADFSESRKNARAFIKRMKDAEARGWNPPKGQAISIRDLEAFENRNLKRQEIVSFKPLADATSDRAKNARREIEWERITKRREEEKKAKGRFVIIQKSKPTTLFV